MKLTKDEKRIFFALFFPTLFETIIIKLFHIADSIMLGQMPDSTAAVAAIGLCAAPVNLIATTTSAFFIGTTATVAWLQGAGEKKSMRSASWQSMIIASALATVLGIVSVIFARPLMAFICTDSEVLDIAASYYRINAYGFIFQIITSNVTAILRGIGISKIPMVYNLTGGMFNVILNYVLIYGKFGFPAMRADGAALATTVSKGVSLAIALCVLFFKDTDINVKHGVSLKFEKSIKSRLIPIGVTAACEQLILQVGAIFTAKIVATLPVDKIAANQIVSSMDGFAWASGSATQAATTTLFGRSLGERKSRKARSYLRLAVRCTLAFAFAEMLIFIVFGRPLAAVFSNDSALYPTIAGLLIVSSFSLPFINVHQTVSGALRSAGDSVAPLIASFVSLWVFRVALGYLLIIVFDMGVYSQRLCLVIDQFVRCSIVSAFYLTGHWKKFLIKEREK